MRHTVVLRVSYAVASCSMSFEFVLALAQRQRAGLPTEGFVPCGEVQMDHAFPRSRVRVSHASTSVTAARAAPVREKRSEMLRSQVYAAIDSERDHQDRKWGTISKHPHEVGGWITLMRKLLNDAEQGWSTSNGDYSALLEIRKVIAVGVACCEQHGVTTRSKHGPVESMRESRI